MNKNKKEMKKIFTFNDWINCSFAIISISLMVTFDFNWLLAFGRGFDNIIVAAKVDFWLKLLLFKRFIFSICVCNLIKSDSFLRKVAIVWVESDCNWLKRPINSVLSNKYWFLSFLCSFVITVNLFVTTDKSYYNNNIKLV